MRLLFLTHRMPFPPNKGDKIRSFHILSYLAKRYEVYLACLVDDEKDLRFVQEVETLVQQVVYARVHPQMKKLCALRALVRSSPITVDYFYSRALQRRIDDIIDDSEIDAFVCFSSPMAEYLCRSRHARGKIALAVKVMDLIDVDSYKWRQYADKTPPWKSWIYRYEARHMAVYERRIAAMFERVYLVSEQEKCYFPGGADVRNLHVLSNGVDLEFFSPAHSGGRTEAGPTLVFTGMMDYRPNVEGVKWFVDRILPHIQDAVSDVRFFIVGNRPAAEVKRLALARGVVVTGFVEDIRDYLAVASVCVVPLRIARGIQNKVLEAMAMGKAVVCTPQAYEGIRAQSGRDLVVAEGEDAFASATIELLRDAEKAAVLGRNARQCVERNYAWEANLAVLGRLLVPDGAGPVVHALSLDCGLGVLG
jgi:polysaccharide biosynthesis protein PslH